MGLGGQRRHHPAGAPAIARVPWCRGADDSSARNLLTPAAPAFSASTPIPPNAADSACKDPARRQVSQLFLQAASEGGGGNQLAQARQVVVGGDQARMARAAWPGSGDPSVAASRRPFQALSTSLPAISVYAHSGTAAGGSAAPSRVGTRMPSENENLTPPSAWMIRKHPHAFGVEDIACPSLPCARSCSSRGSL